ncbi:MAG: aminotransferase class V-fold PLP-dependent enzyme [Candidatus Eisenbacteria bacterium]|nr:aminotransferase class V-fold PLP-dependent enzyme [Candidatus Latescibacterota bacterium]MBD3303169.1 aminotransferase class V-fold PLP-dependent enzyme [Candidatus Eisenbacteria bacterium]
MSDAARRPETIYLDNNATTAVAPEVFEAMRPFLTTDYFNPSSVYERATPVAAALKASRETVARALGGVRPEEIVFTSCATESVSHAVRGSIRANPHRNHIVTTGVEHPAVHELCRDLERDRYDVTFLPVDRSGRIDVADFIRALRTETLLVAVMHANNETGVVFPIEDLSRLTKETDPSILFLTDATQTVGKVGIDLRGALKHVDLLACSGHKFHAPKGVGALFLRRGTPCRPFLVGGHQEGGRRGGTENVAGIVGLARALTLSLEEHDAVEERIRRLRDRLQRELIARIPCVEVNGEGAARLSNTLNLSIHFIEGEGILYQLNEHGICASSGSACTSGSLEPSHVLRAMGVPFTAVHGSLRLSLSRYTTEEEIDRVVEALPEIVARLRRLSPYWDQSRNRPRSEAEAMMRKDPEHTA